MNLVWFLAGNSRGLVPIIKDVKQVYPYAPDAHMKMSFNTILYNFFFPTGNLLFKWL